MIVVSDTSPVCYLILIELIELLHQIYGQVVIPEAVHTELLSSQAPVEVRSWLQSKPEWLTVQNVSADSIAAFQSLDAGEREAIALAKLISADVILIDEKAARRIATEEGLNVVGVLGVLGTAADIGLIEFAATVRQLQQTNMWLSPVLIQRLIKKYSE